MERGGFKNAVMVITVLFGLTILFNPTSGAGRYLMGVVPDAGWIRGIGCLMIGYGICGIAARYNPRTLWQFMLPYALYCTIAIIGIFRVNNPVASSFVLLIGFAALVLVYTLEHMRTK